MNDSRRDRSRSVDASRSSRSRERVVASSARRLTGHFAAHIARAFDVAFGAMFRRPTLSRASSARRTFAVAAETAVDERVLAFLDALKIDKKFAQSLGDWDKCLGTRTEMLKRIGLNVKQRKEFLKYTDRTRAGLFDPFKGRAFEGK